MKIKLLFRLVVLMSFLFYKGNAQVEFKFQTSTDSVTIDGFYKIRLLPPIVAKCKPTLNDLRLLDANGKQVPYMIDNGKPVFEQNKFLAFTRISEYKNKDSSDKILVGNTTNKAINNLVFILKSTFAERSVNISGSNDLQHWYIIKEFINLEMAKDKDSEHYIQSISLPTIHYKYFQIVFNGKQYDPLFIEQIGTYESLKQLKDYYFISNTKIIQNDSSNKTSYIKLISKENYKINKLQLFLSGPKFYERNILFDDGYYNADKQEKVAMVSSRSSNIFFLNLSIKNKTDTLKFKIQNFDNQPLHVDSANIFQDAFALIAYLKAGEKYKLMFGNDVLNAPIYDLAIFKDSVTTTPLVLNTGIITTNDFATSPSVLKSSNAKIWLWVTIITVLVLLILFTVSLLKQIDKKV